MQIEKLNISVGLFEFVLENKKEYKTFFNYHDTLCWCF